jgi:hypothetical protein
MKQQIILTILALSLFSGFACGKGGEEIEKIGSHKITTKDYEDYYSAYVEKASIFTGADKKTLYKFMCNPDQAGNPMIQELLEKLKPENNYEEYRQMRNIEQAAKKDGFMDKPEIKEILSQVVLETTVRLYLQQKMDERIKISVEEKQGACEQLRKEYPDRVGPLPLEDCLYAGEMYIKQSRMRKEEAKLRDEIKESVTIDKNKGFDKDKYLKEKIEYFKTIQKEGGCSAEPVSAAPAGK